MDRPEVRAHSCRGSQIRLMETPQSRGFRSSSMFVALLGKFIWVFAGVSEPVR